MLRVRKNTKQEVGVYWDFDDLRIFIQSFGDLNYIKIFIFIL